MSTAIRIAKVIVFVFAKIVNTIKKKRTVHLRDVTALIIKLSNAQYSTILFNMSTHFNKNLNLIIIQI